MSSGETTLVESPMPQTSSGHVLIETKLSLISAGTERMLVDFGRSSLLDKARKQPDKVKMVLDKIQTDGLLTTIDAVKSKLAQPLPLGYCNVGKIIETGKGVPEFAVGDRVVSNGPHADIVRVVKNLVAKIPDNVDDESAAFTVLGSIGLQGIRLANPTLGESVVVIGAGLIGLMTIQLLVANGCRVLAVDFDNKKLALAKGYGAEVCNPAQGEDVVSTGLAFSRGDGVDAVIITASTQSNDPVSQAANMSRKRGRIVLVGVTGLSLNRAEFYEKELSFQVSCSYGPGRYDADYEDKGQDYPLGFVRWTEQRNFVAILDMMAAGKLDVSSLISHRYLFDDAVQAYQTLVESSDVLGILLQYPQDNLPEKAQRTIPLLSTGEPERQQTENQNKQGKLTVGFVGAGNYASRMLIPAFKKADVALSTIATSGGINGVIHGRANGFEQATTDTDNLLANPAIDVVSIVTQHNSHAHFVEQALAHNKHVFVEKPLAITHEQLAKVEQAYQQANQAGNCQLMVGFNRRFSPHVAKMKSLLAPIKTAKSFILTMNAGHIPKDHWTQDQERGGGRIIGEACHFIDLMRFLADSPITSAYAVKMGDIGSGEITEDKASITLQFEDGSFGTIHYFANGASSFPKERIEVFADGKTLQLDNFRKLRAFGFKGFKKMATWQQDKGQTQCVQAFVEGINKHGKCAISPEEIFEVARVTIDVAEQLRNQA